MRRREVSGWICWPDQVRSFQTAPSVTRIVFLREMVNLVTSVKSLRIGISVGDAAAMGLVRDRRRDGVTIESGYSGSKGMIWE